MTLLAMNAVGYRNLTELVSAAGATASATIGDHSARWVKAAAEGVIALSGAKEGEVGHALAGWRARHRRETLLQEWMAVFLTASISKCSAPTGSTMKSMSMQRVALADKLPVRRWWRPMMCALSKKMILKPTKPACIGEGRAWTIRAAAHLLRSAVPEKR